MDALFHAIRDEEFLRGTDAYGESRSYVLMLWLEEAEVDMVDMTADTTVNTIRRESHAVPSFLCKLYFTIVSCSCTIGRLCSCAAGCFRAKDGEL